MARAPHPKREIEAAIKHAEAEGWRVKVGGSHAWGKIYCPYQAVEKLPRVDLVIGASYR